MGTIITFESILYMNGNDEHSNIEDDDIVIDIDIAPESKSFSFIVDTSSFARYSLRPEK